MAESILEQAEKLVALAAQDVLETMFFTTVVEEDEAARDCDGENVAVRLDFHGTPSGFLEVRLPGAAARAIAATFLGVEEDELSEEQGSGVVGELANMICGAALSRLNEEATFDLGVPRVDRDPGPPPENCAVECGLPLEYGRICLYLATEPPV